MSIPRGIYTKWNVTDSLEIADAATLRSLTGVVLLELDAEWKDLEPTYNRYLFDNLNARLNEAQKYGFKAMITFVTSAVSAPTYLKDGSVVDGKVPTMVTLQSPRIGGPTSVPVFWDVTEPYHSRKKYFYEQLASYNSCGCGGKSLSDHPALAAVMVSADALDWNEMLIVADTADGYSKANAIAAGYTPSAALASAQDMLWSIARLFPNQAIVLSYHRNLIDSGAPFGLNETWLAEQILSFGHTYSDAAANLKDQFYSQIAFWAADQEVATDPLVTGAVSGQWEYLLKMLSIYGPKTGIEMYNNVYEYWDSNYCGLKHTGTCVSSDVMTTELGRADTYAPSFITVWRDDAMLLSAAPTLIQTFASLYKTTTCTMGGQPRLGDPC